MADSHPDEIQDVRRRLEDQERLNELLTQELYMSVILRVRMHELQNRLSHLNAALLAAAHEARKGSQVAQTVGSAIETAGDIHRIVREIAVLNRPGEGRAGVLYPHETVGECVRGAVHDARQIAIARRSRIETRIGERADVARVSIALEVVLEILISNALRAVSEVQRERLVIVEADIRSRNLTLVVLDNGEGIPIDNLHRIWTPGFTTWHGRVGIGLTVARGVVGRCGGRISVDSSWGHYSRFTVTVPTTWECESD